MKKPRLLVILGPTASGKSNLAVHLARKYNGEIVSADSRQVYRGLNIGSGKITKKEMHGIPHHMLDVLDPKKTFTVVDFQTQAYQVIGEIIQRNKLPILCGGTGFYIQSIVDNTVFPEVKANSKLRVSLEKHTTEKLLSMLSKLDKKRAQTIDVHNKVKIIRAIEIAKALGSVPELKTEQKYTTLQIGITTPDLILKEKISKRLLQRIKQGMVNEVKHLHKKGLSYKRLFSLGLEYRYVSLYLQKKISKETLVSELTSAIWQYARRQKTWFRRDERIEWFTLSHIKKIEKRVEKFIAL